MDRAVVHSSTFSKNQLAMVAGLATLQVIDDEDIVARAARNGARLMEALQPLVDRYELFHRHRILTQVAADNVNIIKLLPPLIIGDEEIDHFVGALDDVLGDAHRNSGLLVEVGATMARNSLRRGHRRPAAHEPGPVGS
jgi:ornithine--oxo-acid transaminase